MKYQLKEKLVESPESKFKEKVKYYIKKGWELSTPEFIYKKEVEGTTYLAIRLIKVKTK